MAVKKVFRNTPALFGAGAALLVAGLGSAYIQMRLGIIDLLVSLLGAGCFLLSFFFYRGQGKPLVRVSSLCKYGLAAAIVAVLLTGLAGINYLASRCPWRLDLTRARQHTLSDYTLQVLRQLKDPVDLTTFYVGLPPKYLEDLFKEYERASGGKVKTAIFDPLVDIGYAAQFGNVISGKERKAIVQSASGRKDVDFTDTLLTEEQLTNALLQVTRAVRHVYFLSGHGEYDINSDEDSGLKTFIQLMEKNNIQSRRLVLTGNRIPEDCDVLVIAGPQEQLPANEEQMIEQYLEAGGDALLLVEHTVITTPDKALTEDELHKNPSLNSILTRWGLRVADDIVVDLASHASGDVGSPATRNYPEYKAIVRGLDYTFYIRPRSVSMLGKRRPTIRLASLVLTASPEQSWGETNRNLLVKYDNLLDRPGPVPIAFVVWEPKQGDEKSDTRMAVFTDADFLSNAFIKQYSNAQMGLNVLNWLSELDYQAFIDRKEIKVENLDLTSWQKRAVAVILFAMPLLIAAGGVMMWMRQRLE
ncbi:MAG: GldG family protein [Candidatus Omnitrophica bacterium]|nr:GldG family protein [Candidatus Omnitrophota bacterium]